MPPRPLPTHPVSPGPVPPLRRSIPAGYLPLGMVLVVMSFLFTIGVAAPEVGILLRAGCGIVALASALLVEALWYVRPWVAQAADAWVAACCTAVLFPGLAAVAAGGGSAGIVVSTAMALCFVAVPCGGVRWYVRDRARKLGLAPGVAP
jgi:Zn-dependent M28 family amino/carboxypeptidase